MKDKILTAIVIGVFFLMHAGAFAILARLFGGILISLVTVAIVGLEPGIPVVSVVLMDLVFWLGFLSGLITCQVKYFPGYISWPKLSNPFRTITSY